MNRASLPECCECGKPMVVERRKYRYTESGLPNVVLQGVDVAECPDCGNSEVLIPRLAKVHLAIARALANSPARLTGGQLRFLRRHLGLTGEELARYLHTDKTKISKWETEADPIGPTTDRLMRLLTAALDSDLRPEAAPIAEHLPQILEESGQGWELHIEVATLQAAFVRMSKAA